MASIDQMKRERDEQIADEDTLSRKISELRRAHRIETSAAILFQLKEQISKTTQERDEISARIEELNEQIANAERQQGGGLARAATEAVAGHPRPQSNAYRNARQRIDEAMMQPSQRRAGRMSEIDHSLRRAAQDEGGDEASEQVRCYLRFEQARAHYLRSQDAEARSLFEQVITYLLDTDDEDPLLREAREFLAVLELQKDILDIAAHGGLRLELRIQHIVTFISSSMSRSDLARSPAACLLYHELSQIAQTQRNPVAAEILGPQRVANLQSTTLEHHEDAPPSEQRQVIQDDTPLAPNQSQALLIDGSTEQ